MTTEMNTQAPLLLELSVTENGIQTNVDAIVSAVSERLKKYSYVVDDENQRQAKEDAATLRRIAKQSQGERSRIKKQLLNAFEEPNKKLLALEKRLNSTAQTLADGAEAVDQKRKDTLYRKYQEFWNTKTRGQFPFALVFEQSYLNKTAKAKDVEADLAKKLEDLQTGLEMVRNALPDAMSVDGVMILQDYCKDGDLTGALKRCEQVRQIMEGKQRKREQEQAAQTVEWAPPQPERFDVPIPGDPTESINEVVSEAVSEPVFSYPDDPTITSRWIVTAPKSVCRKAYDALRAMGCQIKVEK